MRRQYIGRWYLPTELAHRIRASRTIFRSVFLRTPAEKTALPMVQNRFEAASFSKYRKQPHAP
jgi:hypothetical protein